MACFALVVLLSLVCLLPGREYHPGHHDSPSTSNLMLSSEVEEELLSIG